MSELKPCPFCGKEPAIDNNFAICVNDDCELSDYWSGLEDYSWNTRPIEDALNARIAELEAERLELRKTLGWTYDLDEYKDNPEVQKMYNKFNQNHRSKNERQILQER